MDPLVAMAVATEVYTAVANNALLVGFTLTIIQLLIVAPVTVYSELCPRRTKAYDEFTRTILDVTMVPAGDENIRTVVERLVPQYGIDVENVVRRVATAQAPDYLRAETIRGSPSSFHAVLLCSLPLGAELGVAEKLALSCKHFVSIYSELSNVSRTQELAVLELVPVLSWFIGYMRGLLSQYLNPVRREADHSAWSTGIEMHAGFDSLIRDVLWCVAILALLYLSIVVEKTKAGSPVHAFRTMLVLLAVVLSIGIVLSQLAAPGTAP